MATNIADLQARLSLDVAQFQRSLQTAQRDLKGFQGIVDAYGRDLRTAAAGQDRLTEAAQRGGRQFQATGQSIAQATRTTRALAGALISELNPALGTLVMNATTASRATQGLGMAVTTLSVGVAAVGVVLTLLVQKFREGAEAQRLFSQAMTSGDIVLVERRLQGLREEMQKTLDAEEELRRRGGFLFGRLMELHEPGGGPRGVAARGAEVGALERQRRAIEAADWEATLGLGLGQAADETAQAIRLLNAQIRDLGASTRDLTAHPIEAEFRASLRQAALEEMPGGRGQAVAAALRRQAAERRRVLFAAPEQLFPGVDLTQMGAEAATTGVDVEATVRVFAQQQAVFAAGLEELATRLGAASGGFQDMGAEVATAGVSAEDAMRVWALMNTELLAARERAREAEVGFEVLRIELTQGADAADLARSAFELFRRRLEELTPLEREQAERLARIARESRELVRLHDDVAQVFGSIGQAIDRMVQGVIMGTQTMADAFNNFFRNVAAQLASNVIRSLLRPVEEALAAMVTRLLTSQITAGGTTMTVGAALGGAAGAAGVLGGQALGGQTGQMLTALGSAASITRGVSALTGSGPAAMQGVFGGAAGAAAGLGVGGGALSIAGMFVPGNAGKGLSVAGSTLSGASLGMMLGSVFPVIGTVIGGIAGALAGLAAGLWGAGVFGGGERKRDIRSLSVAEGMAGAGAFSQLIAQAQNMQDIATAINQAGTLTPFQQLRIAARPAGMVGPGGVLQPPGQQDSFGPADVIRPFTTADLQNPAVLSTLFAASGEVGVVNRNEALTAQLLARIQEIQTSMTAFADGLRGLDQEILLLRASADGGTAALRALAPMFKTELAALVADAQRQLDQAHAELLTLTDPAEIAAQVETIHRLIQERYQGEIQLVQAFVDQAESLMGAWKEAGETAARTIMSLRLSGFGPTNPSEALQLTSGGFQAALAAFRAGPTPELAGGVMESIQPFLEAASRLFDRPSTEFQAIFGETIAALEEIQGLAQDKEAELQQILTDILGEGVTLQALIEENTRKMADDLLGLRDDLRTILGGQGLLPSLQGGGQVLRSGVAVVHEGEMVTPAGGGITVQFGDVHVGGGPEGAAAFMREVERRIRTGRLGVLIADRVRRE